MILFIFTQILTDCCRHRLCTWNQHNQETFQWHKISFEWGNTKEEIQHRQEFFLQHSSMDLNNLEPSWFPLQNHVQDTRIYLWSKDILRLLRFYKCNWPIRRASAFFDVTLNHLENQPELRLSPIESRVPSRSISRTNLSRIIFLKSFELSQKDKVYKPPPGFTIYKLPCIRR